MFVLFALAMGQTTNCYQLGTMVQCQTTPSITMSPPPPVDWSGFQREQQRSSDNLANTIADYRARRAAQAAARAQAQRDENEASYSRWIGSQIAAGQCDAARKDALGQGKFDMAAQVDRLCRPTPP